MLWEIFKVFFRIGGFTIGGGLAMLPLIKDEIVDRKGWLAEDEFLDMLCLTQSFPGVIAVNSAIMVGYRMAGLAGAVVGTLSVIIVPFMVILIIAAFFTQLIGNAFFVEFMKGAAAGVLAVIVGAIYYIAAKIITRPQIALTSLLFLGASLAGVRVIYLIIAAILLGIAVFYVPFLNRWLGMEGAVCEIPEAGEEL